MKGFSAKSWNLKCIVCKTGFFLTFDKKCQKGQVENCSLYKDNDPKTCLICDSWRYILENQICVKN